MRTIYDFTAQTLAGDKFEFKHLSGKVLLIVNTASDCGLTPQYEGLETLHKRYHADGLAVIGFPCNQFGNQEKGDAQSIENFCERNYGVSFLMMDKVKVNCPDAHPIFKWLKEEKGGMLGSAIKWNFTKFLVGRDGEVIARYAPTTKPLAFTSDIEAALSMTQ